MRSRAVESPSFRVLIGRRFVLADASRTDHAVLAELLGRVVNVEPRSKSAWNVGRLPRIWLVLLTTFLWASLAEAGINVWTTNGPEGGSISAVAIDPQTPTTVYPNSNSIASRSGH